MAASHYQLDSLTAILDHNTLQITGRTRDVRTGPDGNLYVLSESEGALLKLEPAS